MSVPERTFHIFSIRDDKQLAGKTFDGADCAENTRNVQPCGFAANTMFTDKIANIKDASGSSQVKSNQLDNQEMNDWRLKRDLSYSMEKYAYAAPKESSQPARRTELWAKTMHDSYLAN